jgi:hypothetical protein
MAESADEDGSEKGRHEDVGGDKKEEGTAMGGGFIDEVR